MGAKLNIDSNSRGDMLAGFGDADITMETYVQAQEEDAADLADIPDAGAPAPEPVKEPEAQEPAEPPAPAPVTAEPSDVQAIAAQNQAYFEEMQKRLDRQLADLKPQTEPQGYQFQEDPVTKLNREVAELRKANQEATQHLEAVRVNSLKAEHEQAVNALREKYPDLDEFVPPALRQQAMQQAIQGKHYGVDWKDAIAQVYKINSFDKYHSAVSKQKDDLALRREEKRQSGMQAASAVSPGGSPFQKPANKPDPRSATFEKDRRAAFQRDLGAG